MSSDDKAMPQSTPNFDFPKRHPYELVLFFYPSPGLDWTNPKGLTFTTARNKLLGYSRGIGHVTVLVRSPERTELTGMTQTHKNEGRAEVLWRGYGLGILLHNFVGELEERAELEPELSKRSRRAGKLSFLRVLANKEITNRLFTYIDEYRTKEYGRCYGMKNRPLHGEGSGCSAFAASFLETAGLLYEDFHKEWTRTFNIPSELIGGPVTGKKVSVLTMLRRAKRWAQEGEPHEKGFFWDPDLMHEWLLRTHEKARPTGSVKADFGKLEVDHWNTSPGLVLDARGSTPPSGKIFHHE